ncbi:hypothetical protein [Moraxella lacunata]|uniref:hypothetical protein n=1 Tax=Moraxella lacunata TaxID=477 RepID=UPI001C6A8B42|nr:hypothetical protein [Moraxella lacunata]
MNLSCPPAKTAVVVNVLVYNCGMMLPSCRGYTNPLHSRSYSQKRRIGANVLTQVWLYKF